MPFKSKAQRRKFAELLVKGEISEETFEEWNRETGSAKLPERVKGTKKPSLRKSAQRSSKANASSKATGKTRRALKRPKRRKGT